MANRRISEEHSEELLRILLDNPRVEDGDVRSAVSYRLGQDHSDDLERHIRWRRRGIYAIIRMLELEAGQAVVESLEDVKAADGIEQWAKVYWMLVNAKRLRNKNAADAGMEELRSWDDCGYAPMANAVLDRLAGVAEQERGRIAEELAAQLSQRDRSKFEGQIAQLTALYA